MTAFSHIKPSQVPFTTDFWANYVNASDLSNSNHQSGCDRGARASRSNSHSPSSCRPKRKRCGTSAN